MNEESQMVNLILPLKNVIFHFPLLSISVYQMQAKAVPVTLFLPHISI